MLLLNTLLAGSGFTPSNVTAFQLLIAGGLFLAVAALMLALSRERRVSLRASAVTDELAVHLRRIANALENLSDPMRDRSHFTDSHDHEVVRPEKPAENSRHVSYSIFGR